MTPTKLQSIYDCIIEALENAGMLVNDAGDDLEVRIPGSGTVKVSISPVEN